MVEASTRAIPACVTVSETEHVVPGARTGAGGFSVNAVSTRSPLTGMTSGVVIAVTSPPFSDHVRILKVFGPVVSALNSHVAERGKPDTTLPSAYVEK